MQPGRLPSLGTEFDKLEDLWPKRSYDVAAAATMAVPLTERAVLPQDSGCLQGFDGH